MEAFSACGQKATEHWVNKRHLPGNENMTFSLSLFDIHYPKSTQWPKLAEPRVCQLKPWEERLKEWRINCSSTDTQRYKPEIKELFKTHLFCPQRSILCSNLFPAHPVSRFLFYLCVCVCVILWVWKHKLAKGFLERVKQKWTRLCNTQLAT